MWSHLLLVASAALGGLWLLSRVPTFHRAYTAHQHRLVADAWLRAQCTDPEFESNIRRYTAACDEALAAFDRPPWLVAMDACLPALPTLGWYELAFGGLLLLLATSMLLPILRAREERWERERILEACNPMLVPHPMLRHRAIAAPALAHQI